MTIGDFLPLSREDLRIYQKEWVARRRKEWFSGKRCVRCDSTDNLQLDHIDSAKKVSHKIWSWSKAKRDVEIAKCQVLCAECHRSKTNQDVYGITRHYQGWLFENY